MTAAARTIQSEIDRPLKAAAKVARARFTQSEIDRAVKAAAKVAGARVILRLASGEIEIIIGESNDGERDEFAEWEAQGKL